MKTYMYMAVGVLVLSTFALLSAANLENRTTSSSTTVTLITTTSTGNHVGVDESTPTPEDTFHSNSSTEDHNNTEHHSHDGRHGIHVASWNYEYVKGPFIITIFTIITAICKLGFHHMEWLSSKVPESCLLILLGIVLGALLKYTSVGGATMGILEPRTFFLFLLPPIILESAFSLHDRVFFDNLGTILIYAVIGTLITWVTMGGCLYGLNISGAMGGDFSLGFIPSLVFSSLIVAVDPVAVLAIFQEVGVNNVLYFLVFGESLLNDAVTVVIYNTMNTMNNMEEIGADQIILAIVAFFTVSIGGLIIGLIYGALTAILTRFTEKVKVVEPLAVLSFAYAAYLTAELFHFSGIISIIGCGLMQAQYTFHNIGHKSLTTIKYFSKMLCSTCECIIFMFLGISVVRADHQWNTGFVLWTAVLCLAIRFIVIFSLTYITNKGRLRTIDYEEQFIMAYGGLRGAIAFCLVTMLKMDEQNLFETTTIVVILCTVFLQGTTIKPLVKQLRIKQAAKKNSSISVELNSHVVDHLVAGIEEILGHLGHNAVREYFHHFDEKHLKVWFQREPKSKDDHIMEIYKELTIRQHYITLTSGTCSSEPEPGPDDTSVRNSSGFKEPRTSYLERYQSSDITSSRISHRCVDAELGARRRNRISYPPAKEKTNPAREPFERTVSLQETENNQTKSKKQGTLSRIFSRGVYDPTSDIILEPTANDLQMWVVKPIRQALGQKYDRNLINDHETDIVHHLDEKKKKLQRMLTSKLQFTSMESVFGEPQSPGLLKQTTVCFRSEPEILVQSHGSAKTSLGNKDHIELQEIYSSPRQRSQPESRLLADVDNNQNESTTETIANVQPNSNETDSLLNLFESPERAASCRGKLTRQKAMASDQTTK